MKIAFNPSTVEALIAPPNNKDITFDLRGQNIFARGVKFCGTDTNTWRDIKINNVSIGSNTLDLRNGSNTTLTNTNGVVTINSTWRPVVDNLTSDSTTSSLSAKQGKVLKSLIDGKSNSGHTHDDRYLKLTGGIMQLGEGLKFHADNNYFESNADARIISLLDNNDKICGGGLIIDERATLDGKEYVTELLRIRDSEFKWKGSNILHSGNTYVSNNKGYINNTEITLVNNSDMVDGYHASSLWRSDGGIWNPYANISLTASENNQEWSFDIRRNGHTGCYWHVWDSTFSTLLKVNADDGKVYAPYNFVGNLEGNASSATYLNIQYCRDDNYPSNKGLWNTIKNGTTNAINNRVRFYTIYGSSSDLGAPETYGELLEICSYISNHWQPLLWFGAGTGGRLYYRNKDYNNDTWGAWRTLAWTSDIPTVTDYYWANIKVSASSSTTTTPTFGKLYISGAYPHIDMTSTSAESSIYFRPSSGTSWAIGKAPWGVGGFGIGILSDGSKLTILDNGNVGIGTDSPSYKLTVNGWIDTNGIYTNRTGSSTDGGVSLYSNVDPMTYGIAFRGTGTYGTHGYVTSTGDWATYLTMNDSTTRGWIFRRGDTNVASIAGSGNMAIGLHLEFSNEAHISTNRSTDYHYGYTFNLGDNTKSIGMYSGPAGEAGGVVISPDGCLIYNSSDCGYNLQVRDKDLGSDLTNIATLTFGIELSGYYAWSRGGFKKNGSSDSYVLLGGGGHKALSDFMSSTIKYALSDTIGGNALLAYKLYYPSSVLKDLASIDNFHETRTFKYGIWLGNSEEMGSSFPGTYNGIILSGGWTSVTYGFQLAIDNDPNYFIALRQRNNGTWSTWKRIPMGDGTGASGTWKINITGNADTVDGFHANGLLTALSNSNNGVSITVGETTKSISNISVNYANSAGNADTLDGLDSTKFLRQVVVPNNTENDFNTFSNMTLTGRTDPTTGASLKNAPWSGSGPAGGYGVLTYLFDGSGYGTQMAWGHGNNRIYIRNRYWGGPGVGSVWRTSWDTLALTSDIPTSLKSPYSLTLKANGTTLAVYDGSSAKEANFTYANVGAASASHTHSWSSITDKIVAGDEFNIVNAGFNNRMWFNYLPINDRSKTATISYYCFGNGQRGYASVTASGFVKDGSSSSYVLLGDGGHQTISSLSVNYASSAGNADKLDGYHANGSNVAPYGHIPTIESDGVMEVGKYIDFHNDNSGEHDFSTRLQSTGNYGNIVNLPSTSGTLALTSDIPTVTNYYWANVKISDSSSTTTSPTVSNLTATSSIKMGNILLEHTDEINNSANGGLHLNYRNSGNISLCQGGGNVGIGTSPLYKLDVNGLMRANGFRHSGHNSDDAVLLAGGGYKTLSDLTNNYYWAYDNKYIKLPICLEFVTFVSYQLTNSIWSSPTYTNESGVTKLTIPNLTVPYNYDVYALVISHSNPNTYATIMTYTPLLIKITHRESSSGYFAVMIWAIPS